MSIEKELAPIVKIYTSKGRFLTEVIEKFKYKFSEEEDDVCELTIRSDDPNLPDDPELQEGKWLKVSWGYIGGKMSKDRKIYIFDTRATFDEEGVTLCLYGHELFAQAKMNVVKTKSKKNAPVKKIPLAIPANLKVEIDPKVKKALENKYDLSTVQEIKPPDGIKLPKPNSAYQIKDNIPHPEPDLPSSNGNVSTFQNLRRDLDRVEGGPYMMDSRDDNLVIRPRNYNQKPKRSYKYKGENGNLLSFNPETKNRSKASTSERINVTNWNPELKQAYIQQSNTDNSKDKVALAPVNDYILTRILGTSARVAPVTNPNDAISPGALNILRKTGRDRGDGPVQVTAGNFKVKNWGYNNESTSVVNQSFDIITDDGIGDSHLSSSNDLNAALAEATSYRKLNENENNPASAVVIGEPTMESGEINTFLNVSKKFSGNYYLVCVEHDISAAGYFTTISKMGRQGTNKTKKQTRVSSGPEPTYYVNDEFAYPNNDDQVINTEIGPNTAKQRESRVSVKTKSSNNS